MQVILIAGRTSRIKHGIEKKRNEKKQKGGVGNWVKVREQCEGITKGEIAKEKWYTVCNWYRGKLNPSRGHVSEENPRGGIPVAEEIGLVVAKQLEGRTRKRKKFQYHQRPRRSLRLWMCTHRCALYRSCVRSVTGNGFTSVKGDIKKMKNTPELLPTCAAYNYAPSSLPFRLRCFFLSLYTAEWREKERVQSQLKILTTLSLLMI